MKYADLKQTFQQLKSSSPRENLTAHIIFTENSFDRTYPLLSRTYRISSDSKAFWSRMGGRSIFAYCLDKSTDQGVRLDWYMSEEGNAGGWEVEDCYILEHMPYADHIPSMSRVKNVSGITYYFFGATCIQAREVMEGDKVILEPVEGIQFNGTKYEDLGIDRVYGYCTLLERHINTERGKEK